MRPAENVGEVLADEVVYVRDGGEPLGVVFGVAVMTGMIADGVWGVDVGDGKDVST